MKPSFPELRPSFRIGNRAVGADQPCVIVAEVAQAHDGSLGAAHAYIDAAAGAGADVVKFQTHIAAAESTPAEQFRVPFSLQDASRYEYWKRMEFSEAQWAGLASHAADRGIVFLSSPFSFEAVEMLERIGAPAWKIGAGEIANLPLVERVSTTGKPVLLSSGMSGWDELDAAVARVRQHGADLAVYQCTSVYPCPAERVGLNAMAALRERYGCPVGLSDHSGTIYAGLAARTLGAELLEVHLTLSRDAFGPDVTSSVTTAELRQLVDGVRFIERALRHPVDKEAAAEALAPMRTLFGRSALSAHPLGGSHRLVAEDIVFKKPAGGFAPSDLATLVGRVLKRDVGVNHVFVETDFE